MKQESAHSDYQTTIPALFQKTVSEMGGSSAFRFERDGEWQTLTWNDYAQRAQAVAGGLKKRGLSKGDHVVLLTKNSPEFHIFDMALMIIGAIPVSVYNSPSVRPLAHIIKDSQAKASFVNDPVFAERMVKAINMVTSDHLLITATSDEPPFENAVRYEDLIADEPVDLAQSAADIEPSEVAVMLYTSGTSGTPKGVPLTHANLAYAAFTFSDRSGVPLQGKRQLSYLPMAHIGERFATHYAHVASGSEVTTCPEMSELHRFIAATHPHMLFGAPRMWEVLHERITTDLSSDPERSMAFHAAVEASSAESAETASRQPNHVIEDVLAEYGLDQIQIAIVGSAPLPEHIHRFWLACGLPLADYYGQTETSGMGSWDPHDITLGTVGKPLKYTQMRISELGEIEISGPGVFSGYYKNPEKTEEAFTSDGWYRTGDLGRFDEEGRLIYIGRMNDMIVPTSGHNVSPIEIEAQIASHPWVSYACLVGTGRPHVGAVIVLNREIVSDWLTDHNIEVAADGDIADIDPVTQEIDDHLSKVNTDLPGAERVRSRIIVADEWALDSPTLTPTGKMKRSGVLSRYAAEIDAMYSPERSSL